jgi:hypothetical protein
MALLKEHWFKSQPKTWHSTKSMGIFVLIKKNCTFTNKLYATSSHLSLFFEPTKNRDRCEAKRSFFAAERFQGALHAKKTKIQGRSWEMHLTLCLLMHKKKPSEEGNWGLGRGGKKSYEVAIA